MPKLASDPLAYIRPSPSGGNLGQDLILYNFYYYVYSQGVWLEILKKLCCYVKVQTIIYISGTFPCIPYKELVMMSSWLRQQEWVNRKQLQQIWQTCLSCLYLQLLEMNYRYINMNRDGYQQLPQLASCTVEQMKLLTHRQRFFFFKQPFVFCNNLNS